MRIADVMTWHPVASSVNDRMTRAAEIMRDLGVGLVPIIDNESDR